MTRIAAVSVCVPLLAQVYAASCAVTETARVCQIDLQQFLDSTYDVRVFLYQRGGAFYHGYAIVPRRDSLPHRIDPTPAAPFGLYHADGTEIDYPASMGVYAYHNPDYKVVRELYNKGKIVARQYDPPEPVRWNGTSLTGTFDIWIMSASGEANKWGLEPKNIRSFRVSVTAKAAGDGTLGGAFEAWSYEVRDRAYGKGNQRFKGALTGRWREDFWEPRPGSAYSAGKDWPCARGPHLNGSAVDCDAEMVDRLEHARLRWVAEEIIPGGKGGGPKVAFHYTPANWAGLGYGGYSGPVVAGGKVFLFLIYPDLEKLEKSPEARKHILSIRGAPLARVASELRALRDAVLCFDARTGKTLWRYVSEWHVGRPSSGKSGKGCTPCVYSGKLYARGSGIYCLDAKNGELKWFKRGRDRKDRSYSLSGGWSRDQSPVVIGGTLVFHVYPDTTLVGLDPETGNELWRLENACGWNAVPSSVLLGGKEYIISAHGVDIRTKGIEEQERMVLIEPKTGTIVWESKEMGKTGVSLAVWQDLVCGNVVKGLSAGEGKGVDDAMRTGCFRVTPEGAEKVWTAKTVHYPPHRATPIAHRGHFYIDSRITGFACVAARTGTIVGRHKHIYAITGGDHNWTWHVATNGRIVTSGCLMFSDAAGGFRQLPGRLALPLVSGYMCPVKPAIADGRLFVRTLDKLVCYDLRKPREK
ncbi:MAG: PQQ-like beta-propeller repeat protein [Phycisphaerales bacterium]|nr:MAG: PQQ-like beta-propeller repeat protein [Phycisphaerales bacterium]